MMKLRGLESAVVLREDGTLLNTMAPKAGRNGAPPSLPSRWVTVTHIIIAAAVAMKGANHVPRSRRAGAADKTGAGR